MNEREHLWTLSYSSWDHQGFDKQSKTVAEVELVICFLGTSQHFSEDTVSTGPSYFSVGFFFVKLFLLCQFERPGFCYLQTSDLIKLTLWLLVALPEMSIPRAVPKNSYQLPVSIIQKLLLKTYGETQRETLGKGGLNLLDVQSSQKCYMNYLEANYFYKITWFKMAFSVVGIIVTPGMK